VLAWASGTPCLAVAIAAIAAAVEAGRRVYDNVRKFICYIFTHAVPEVLPFLIFALADPDVAMSFGRLP
jgi:magnesium-transporting ATPase (P-type)